MDKSIIHLKTMTKKLGRIRDVARETGLSTATVSRVMNGATNVSQATRERVLNASLRLNYLPNPAARALSTSRSKTIAAIVPTIEYSIFAKYLTSIEQVLADRDYSLVIALSSFDETEELVAARKLLGMGAEAFILSGTEHSEVLVDLLDRRSVPYAYTSVWDSACAVPTIGYDNAALAKAAISFLYRNGHRRISVIHGPLHNNDRTRARKDGALAARRRDLQLDFLESELSVGGGKQAMKSVLDSQNDSTAVLCFSDVLALGSYFAIQERNLKIPDDISVMGFDNMDWSADVTPALTTIDLPAGEMGKCVAQQLMDHLEGTHLLAPQLLDGQIIKRSSVRKLHRRKSAAN